MKESLPLAAAAEAAGASPRFRWTIAAAIIVKDEAPHIEEWIVYHHLIGIEHVFVYDNDSSDELRDVLAPYITRGLVTYIYWPHARGQVDAYAHACAMAAPLADWLCLFDADEFLALHDIDDLPAYLNGLPCDQVLVRWRLFGHSGHRARPDGLTVETFVHCEPQVVHIVKQIVRPRKVRTVSVHFSRTLERRTCDANGEPVREGWAIRRPPGRQALELHHYYSRSYDDYLVKMERKNASGGLLKDAEPFERWDFSTRNDMLARFAPAIRAFTAEVGRLPRSPLHAGSLGLADLPRAATALWTRVDQILEEARGIANGGGHGRSAARLRMGPDGTALVVNDPPPDALARVRAFIADETRALAEEAGLLPLATLRAEPSTKGERYRVTGETDEASVLPGYVVAFVVAEPAPFEQTLRLRVVERAQDGPRQFFKVIGVAPGTLHVTARLIETPCRPGAVEVRWLDGAPEAGALWAQFALIA